MWMMLPNFDFCLSDLKLSLTPYDSRKSPGYYFSQLNWYQKFAQSDIVYDYFLSTGV